jgi:hypothetical protein
MSSSAAPMRLLFYVCSNTRLGKLQGIKELPALKQGNADYIYSKTQWNLQGTRLPNPPFALIHGVPQLRHARA